MDDRLSIPPVRVPAVLPHPDDLLVTLVKDEHASSINITSPLTPETVPNNDDARATLHAIRRLRQALTSPYNTPDAILDRPTWLRVIMETLAGIHEGFHTAQLASPDEDLPDSFRNLSPEELNTVGHIFDITGSIHDFCEPVDENPDEAFRAICIRCVQAVDLPPPPANITDIMLSTALEARAVRETLRNEAIRKAVHDIDLWRETQQAALIDSLVSDIVNRETNPDEVARSLGKLDPRIEAWVDSIRPHLKESILKMVAQEPIEDFVSPQVEEILYNAWTKKQMEINAELETRTSSYVAQLQEDSDTFLASKKQILTEEAEASLSKFEADLKAKTEDEIQRLKSKYKLEAQAAKEDLEARSLSLAIRTPKPAKPSPLNITKPKKKKKKVHILDLTTPSPGPGPEHGNDSHTDMETDAESTPTTPICRSSAPSPALPPTAPVPGPANTPFPTAPDEVPLATADPESIPAWVRTPSPDDRTPHASSFQQPQAPPDGLAAIMVAINGLKTEMMAQINKVNARIDESIAPTNIADYMAGIESNLGALEEPTYPTPAHDRIMEEQEAANLDRYNKMLQDQTFFRHLLIRLTSEKRVSFDLDNEYYIEQWYQMCTDLCKSLHWDAADIPATADETILNAWQRLSTTIFEEEFTISISFIYERITGYKPDKSSPEGRARLTTFTTVYNDFCATYNYPAHEGFPESQDAFFKHLLATGKQAPIQQPKETPAPAQPPKSVRFTSAPPIATLPASISDDEFPMLRAPSQEPISYASAAGAFIPVTRRRRNKGPQPTPTIPTPTKPGPKPIRPVKPTPPAKPPLPDALKTTKYTIILDHTAPTAKALYALDAGTLTRGLQTHLETVKAPLVLLAGSWSSAPFYKNFILTFSGIVNFTDITKYNSILFGPFGSNCRAAPTAGYQSILISGVRLHKDSQGKLASSKMLYEELCRNPVFVGRLPLAAPRWLFNPDKLLESGKEASSITFSFHDPTGEGLELMRRSRVGMFGKLVSIRGWEARPLLSQCTRCLRLGHTVERCRRHKDLVVCSKCGGAHQDALHHFNCPHANKHKGRGCDCPPSCFLCIAQGNPKAAQGHTSTSVSCPIRKHFRSPPPTTDLPDRQRSITIPPTPAASGPMRVLTSDTIKQLSSEGMAVDDITRLLVPPEVANLAPPSTRLEK